MSFFHEKIDQDSYCDLAKQRAKNVAELAVHLNKLKETADDFYHEIKKEENAKHAAKRKRSSRSEDVNFSQPRKCSTSDLPRRFSMRNLGLKAKSYADMVQFDDKESMEKRSPFAAKLKSFTSRSSFDTPINKDVIRKIDWKDTNNEGPTKYLGECDKHCERYEKEWCKIIAIFENYKSPLAVSDVSEAMIKYISYTSTDKVYDKELGTSCHQCRQKTLDTKSVCRWPMCKGVRGQFCGFCLWKRYGEKVEDALKNENWMCPVCREICNCSICRTKAGLAPTGILAPIAQEEGFKSVQEFLLEKEGLPNSSHDIQMYLKNLKSCKKGRWTLTETSNPNEFTLVTRNTPEDNPQDNLTREGYNKEYIKRLKLEQYDGKSDVKDLHRLPDLKLEVMDTATAAMLQYSIDFLEKCEDSEMTPASPVMKTAVSQSDNPLSAAEEMQHSEVGRDSPEPDHCTPESKESLHFDLPSDSSDCEGDDVSDSSVIKQLSEINDKTEQVMDEEDEDFIGWLN